MCSVLRVAVLAVLAVGCFDPTVRVETPKPIAVDINMRVDIYQHDGKDPDSAAKSGTGTPGEISDRRRTRMAEIQTLKNSRLVGENHQALLTIRDLPPGPYGDYVKKTVEAENADREAQMVATAKSEKKPIADVRKTLAGLWRDGAFPGEWIEVQNDRGVWEWIQKPGEDEAAS